MALALGESRATTHRNLGLAKQFLGPRIVTEDNVVLLLLGVLGYRVGQAEQEAMALQCVQGHSHGFRLLASIQHVGEEIVGLGH